MNRVFALLAAALSVGTSIQAGDNKSLGPELSFATLPLAFEPNMGQGDPAARFLARGAVYSVKLESSRAVLDLNGRSVSMELLNAAAQPGIQGEAPLPGKANYFGSSDPKTWFTNIPTYSRVLYKDVYPGVGLAFYGKDNRLEYDFLLDAGANPGQIRMRLSGAESVNIDAAGDLVLNSGKGEIRFYKPIAWQQAADGKARDTVCAPAPAGRPK